MRGHPRKSTRGWICVNQASCANLLKNINEIFQLRNMSPSGMKCVQFWSSSFLVVFSPSCLAFNADTRSTVRDTILYRLSSVYLYCSCALLVHGGVTINRVNRHTAFVISLPRMWPTTSLYRLIQTPQTPSVYNHDADTFE